MQDLRYACRTLRKQPVFTLIAVLTLTLGIGANTAVFSLLYQVVLRPLPFPEGQRLIYVGNIYASSGPELSDVSIPDYLDRRAQASAFEDAALFTGRTVTLTDGTEPEQLNALAVTPSFFSTLRRGPALGRAFGEADAVRGADTAVILTHGLWASRFGSDPALVGRTLRIDGERHEVVGVLPADFEVPGRDVALLMPFAFTAAQTSDQERGNEFSQMIARLRPGGTIAQADAQMAAIVSRLMTTVPARADYMRSSGFGGAAVDLRGRLVGRISTSLYLLQGGVLLVLLIACANVGNLVLMRATGRHRELAVRASLGASGMRILRQLLVEGAVLSALGAAGGLALGLAATRMVAAMLADQLPRGVHVTPHPAVLLFAALLAAVTTVVAGVIPAIPAMRGRLAGSLKEDATRGTAGSRTAAARSVLAITEVAIALVLLVGAGLLVKSFMQVTRVDPGFSADRVLTAQLTLPAARYRDSAERVIFWQTFIDRARAIPGVSAAGLVSTLPFSDVLSAGTYRVVDRPVPPGTKPPHALDDRVFGDYFRAMGIPLLQGRLFDDRGTPDSPRVVIVDRFLADKQFPHDSAIGHQLNFGSPRNYTIVGVVGTVHTGDLGMPVPEERIYFSASQLVPAAMTLTVKSAGDPASIAPQIRGAVQSIDREQAVARMRTMEEWISRSLQPRRAPAVLVAVFGAVAVALAAIGIYGVLAFGVTQRAREFGIRQALGADRTSILSLVVRQGLRTAGLGIAFGIGGALVVTRWLQSLLFGVTPHDAGVFVAVSGLLFAVALAACYVPARRASRVDPMVALRDL